MTTAITIWIIGWIYACGRIFRANIDDVPKTAGLGWILSTCLAAVVIWPFMVGFCDPKTPTS